MKCWVHPKNQMFWIIKKSKAYYQCNETKNEPELTINHDIYDNNWRCNNLCINIRYLLNNGFASESVKK